MTAPFRTVFAVYEGMTHLDFTGPHQFMVRLPNSETIVASRDGGEVDAEGLTFGRTRRLADIESCDLICIPGGLTATQVANDAAFMAEVTRLSKGARYLTSVCTGSLVLAATGLIRGRRAACHWAWRELLTEFDVIPDPARVVRDGNVITGGGVTAGIDFALTVLAELAGEDFAKTIQLGLEYDPKPPFNSGRPEIAEPQVLARYNGFMEKLMPERRREARVAAEMMKV